MLLLSFGLFLWACKDENSLHRACNLSVRKEEAKGKNNFGERGENRHGLTSGASVPHVSGGRVLISGALKQASGLRIPQEPQLPAWTSKMPKGGQHGSSRSSSPSVPSVVHISCWGWRGCTPQYWDVYCRAVWGWFNIKVVLKTTRQARQWLLVK